MQEKTGKGYVAPATKQKRKQKDEGGVTKEDEIIEAGARAVPLLPTPAALVANDGEGPETWLARRRKVAATAANGNGMGMPLTIAVQLLPTPTVGDCGGPEARSGNGFGAPLGEIVRGVADWGAYAPAVHRWERVLGRPAPAPTHPSKTGKPQLSPVFVEWMMGLPEGWVTDVGITRSQQLRALGNGVVPQQAAYAVGGLLQSRASNVLF